MSMVPWSHASFPSPKNGHLDQFIRFCKAHSRDQHTDMPLRAAVLAKKSSTIMYFDHLSQKGRTALRSYFTCC